MKRLKVFLKIIKIKASSYLHIEEVSKDQYLIAENFPVCQWNNPLACWQFFGLQMALQFEDSSSICRHFFNLHIAFPFANSSPICRYFFRSANKSSSLKIDLQYADSSSICRSNTSSIYRSNFYMQVVFRPTNTSSTWRLNTSLICRSFFNLSIE